MSRKQTLLEDLLSFAEACESGDWGDLNDDAKRLRAHAKRLQAEAKNAREKAALPWSEGRTKALIERLNGGPLPEPTEDPTR